MLLYTYKPLHFRVMFCTFYCTTFIWEIKLPIKLQIKRKHNTLLSLNQWFPYKNYCWMSELLSVPPKRDFPSKPLRLLYLNNCCPKGFKYLIFKKTTTTTKIAEYFKWKQICVAEIFLLSSPIKSSHDP